MAVSLGGFILSFNKLDDTGLTGRAVSSGTTNFTINSSVSVVFLISNANFGTGIVNATGNHNCTLYTTGQGMLNGGSNSINGPDCIGFVAQVLPLRLQNQGTLAVTLNVTFSNNKTTFVGGTNPEFGFDFSANESNPCGGTSTFYGSYRALNNVSQSTVNITICNATQFSFSGGNRTLDLDIGMRIPQNAFAGARTTTITAYATNP